MTANHPRAARAGSEHWRAARTRWIRQRKCTLQILLALCTLPHGGRAADEAPLRPTWSRSDSAGVEWVEPTYVGSTPLLLIYSRQQSLCAVRVSDAAPLHADAFPVGTGLQFIGTALSGLPAGRAVAYCHDRSAVYAFELATDDARMLWRVGAPFDRPEAVRDDPEFLSGLEAASVVDSGVVLVRNDGSVGLFRAADGRLIRRGHVPRAAAYRVCASETSAAILSLGTSNIATVFDLSDAPPADDEAAWGAERTIKLPAGQVFLAEAVDGELVVATRSCIASASLTAARPPHITPRWNGLRRAAIAIASARDRLPGDVDVRNVGPTLLFADERAAPQARAPGNPHVGWYVSSASAEDAARVAGDIRFFGHSDKVLLWGPDQEVVASQVDAARVLADWRNANQGEIVGVSLTGQAGFAVVTRRDGQICADFVRWNVSLAIPPRYRIPSRASGDFLPARVRVPTQPPPAQTVASFALENAPMHPHSVRVVGDTLLVQDATEIVAYRIPP